MINLKNWKNLIKMIKELRIILLIFSILYLIAADYLNNDLAVVGWTVAILMIISDWLGNPKQGGNNNVST